MRLAEPLRTRAELIKLAVLAGHLVVGGWASWDKLDLPTSALLKRLRIASFAEVLAQVRQSLEERKSRVPPYASRAPASGCRSFTYCNLAGGGEDFLAQLLETRGVKLVTTSREICDADSPVLINCLEAPLHRLRARINPRSPHRQFIVCRPDILDKCSQLGRAAALPCSLGCLNRLMADMDDNGASLG